jgi:hypothetical protein
VSTSLALAPNGRVFDLPAIVAAEEGIFERHGLDVRFSATGPAPSVTYSRDSRSRSSSKASPTSTTCASGRALTGWNGGPGQDR